jgi:predicted O-methyltransferase YrrM
MNISELEKQDTVVVAKHILGRLNIPLFVTQEKKLLTPKSKSLISAIENIESIEKIWKLKKADQKHTYGRKHLGESIGLWSVPYKSAHMLENLAVLTGAKKILEVGTSAGYSTLHLAHGASQNRGSVHTIENLKEKIELAKKNFKTSRLKNITLIEGEALSVLKKWKQNKKFDLVFLDADKENYGKYFDLLVPLLKIGGLIVADNINDYGHMMEDYLQKVSGTHLPRSRTDHRVKSYYLAALDNGLMITKKISD